MNPLSDKSSEVSEVVVSQVNAKPTKLNMNPLSGKSVRVRQVKEPTGGCAVGYQGIRSNMEDEHVIY